MELKEEEEKEAEEEKEEEDEWEEERDEEESKELILWKVSPTFLCSAPMSRKSNAVDMERCGCGGGSGKGSGRTKREFMR